MVTPEQAIRNEGYGEGWREAIKRTRDEIDIAYIRGYEDGSHSFLPLVTGLVVGAGATALGFWIFL